MSAYFNDKSMKFMRGLARNNNREWFTAHKPDYEQHVRAPFQALLCDLQAPLHKISTRYRADPKPIGGSLFRLHRDTRFSNDKTPYKRWQGGRLYHERHKEVEAPSFYLHFQPGQCFIGAGLWHPQPDTLRRIRQFIVENPESWTAAAHAPAFRKHFDFDDTDMLVRPPRGYPKDSIHADDLRRRNHVVMRSYDDATMCGRNLLPALTKDLTRMAPYIDYLCASLDLEF